MTVLYVAGRVRPSLERSLVNLDAEANLPAWWSSVLLLAGAAVALGLWTASTTRDGRQWHWLALSVGFFGLSAEEVAGVHEQIDEFIPGLGPLEQLWPILYAPILILGVMVILRAARSLEGIEKRLCLAGAISYVVVVAVELGTYNVSFRETTVSVVVEESAEFVGTLLILVALASVLARRIDIVPRAEGRAGG